jgi:hypothetical protein
VHIIGHQSGPRRARAGTPASCRPALDAWRTWCRACPTSVRAGWQHKLLQHKLLQHCVRLHMVTLLDALTHHDMAATVRLLNVTLPAAGCAGGLAAPRQAAKRRRQQMRRVEVRLLLLWLDLPQLIGHCSATLRSSGLRSSHQQRSAAAPCAEPPCPNLSAAGSELRPTPLRVLQGRMVRRAMSLDEPQTGAPPQLAARALSGVDQATFSFLDAQLARFQADPR